MSRPTVRTAAIVAPSPVPLRLGGAERHWETLRRSMEDAGIAADLVKVPVREHTLVDLLQGYEDFANLDLSHVDLVITGKYPAWMVSHPNHVVWMLHPLRGLYDTYNPAAYEGDRTPPAEFAPLIDILGARRVDPGAAMPEPSELIEMVRELAAAAGPSAAEPGGPLALPGPLAREVVHALDAWALDPRRVRRHLAISSIVANRSGYFPAAVDPTVLIPPACLQEPPPSAPPSVDAPPVAPTRLLAVGRLEEVKRFDLAIAAMAANPDERWELAIIGDGPDRARLEDLARSDERVSFAGRISDAALADAYRRSDAVIVTPESEDFGYVTIEAFQAGRPVITTTDSGGPAELATDGFDSFVVDPTAASIATAMRRVATNTAGLTEMAAHARSTSDAHSWPRAVQELLTPRRERRVDSTKRGRIVALSTYPIADWPGGGPQRARQLLRGLSERGWMVEVVSISPDDSSRTVELGDGLTEQRVALSQRHLDADQQLRRLTANVSTTDITASVLWPSSIELVRAISNALDGAAAVVAIQPYLASAAQQLAPEVPLLLDSHNHERTLKAQMFPDSEAGRWMLDRVTDAEATATATARLVVATTVEDARSLESDHGLPAGSIAVVPNGVSSSTSRPRTAEEHEEAKAKLLAELDPGGQHPSIAIFVGSAHRPNVDAAREVLAIARDLPEVLFVLAGEHSDQLDRHDCPRNVVCLGAVSEERLTALLAAADVALNPMRSGGGSNLKVLQYFASGVPVVSTPIGVRGVDRPERYAAIVSIDRFAAELALTLAGDAQGATSERAAAARSLVENHFDWDVAAQRFAELVEDSIDA